MQKHSGLTRDPRPHSPRAYFHPNGRSERQGDVPNGVPAEKCRDEWRLLGAFFDAFFLCFFSALAVLAPCGLRPRRHRPSCTPHRGIASTNTTTTTSRCTTAPPSRRLEAAHGPHEAQHADGERERPAQHLLGRHLEPGQLGCLEEDEEGGHGAVQRLPHARPPEGVGVAAEGAHGLQEKQRHLDPNAWEQRRAAPRLGGACESPGEGVGAEEGVGEARRGVDVEERRGGRGRSKRCRHARGDGRLRAEGQSQPLPEEPVESSDPGGGGIHNVCCALRPFGRTSYASLISITTSTAVVPHPSFALALAADDFVSLLQYLSTKDK